MKQKSFLSNALILTAGSVLAKVFSAVYRIGLTRILGGVGIGIYQLVFPVYSLCVVLATAGLPMAISKVVARNKHCAKSVLKKCFISTSLMSLALTFLLCVFSRGIADVQGNAQLTICYLLLAPTIIIISVSSVLRGYFQGVNDFNPSSISNIVEQFVKLVVGLVLSLILIRVSLFAAIVGAVGSIIVSEILGVVVLVVFIKKRRLATAKCQVTFKEIYKDILPITATNLILPIASFVDSLVVVNLLSFNFANPVSTFLYGLESGAVSSLVSLPTIFSFAVASVILPNITNENNQMNKNKKFSLAIKLVLIICIPCVVAFVTIPNELIELLYGGRLNDFAINGARIASRLLAISSFGVLFLALSQIYSSCLQAVNERYVAVRNLLIGVGAKFFLELIFMPSLSVNIYALAVANTACYLVVMALNHFEVRENFSFSIDFIFAGKLILANVVMVLTLVAVLAISKHVTIVMLAIILAILVYFSTLIITKIFNKKDVAFWKYKL